MKAALNVLSRSEEEILTFLRQKTRVTTKTLKQPSSQLFLSAKSYNALKLGVL